MWERKTLKERAKKVVKKNYWTAIVVCFLIALLTGEFGTSIVGIWQSEDSMDPNYVIWKTERYNNSNIIPQEESKNLQDEIEENVKLGERKTLFSKLNIRKTLNDTQIKIFQAVEDNLNSATKSQKYIFKIWDAINLFNMNKTNGGVFLCIAALLAICFTIFVADPLIVGGKKYFLSARESDSTRASVVLEVFKNNNWGNVALTMLLRNIYNALWYITIIGGVVKTYEYRMIPYILAENPKIKRKEAFKLSKQMMKGNKWKTFILDMSFFGWNFLSVLSFGILSILYVNPYNAATTAELYVALKDELEHIS